MFSQISSVRPRTIQSNPLNFMSGQIPCRWFTRIRPSRILNDSVFPSFDSVFTISCVRKHILAADAGEVKLIATNIAQRISNSPLELSCDSSLRQSNGTIY